MPTFLAEQVAKVLNPDDVESDLVPAMEAFLRDMEDVSSRRLWAYICYAVVRENSLGMVGSSPEHKSSTSRLNEYN